MCSDLILSEPRTMCFLISKNGVKCRKKIMWLVAEKNTPPHPLVLKILCSVHHFYPTGITFFNLGVLKLASDCGAPHFTVYGSLKRGFSLRAPKRLLQKYLWSVDPRQMVCGVRTLTEPDPCPYTGTNQRRS